MDEWMYQFKQQQQNTQTIFHPHNTRIIASCTLDVASILKDEGDWEYTTHTERGSEWERSVIDSFSIFSTQIIVVHSNFQARVFHMRVYVKSHGILCM